MSKSTFRILFYIRKNQVNKEGKAGIMIRLTVNGEIAQFSSKLDVEPDLWDVNSQKMQGNSLKARAAKNPEKEICLQTAGTGARRVHLRVLHGIVLYRRTQSHER